MPELIDSGDHGISWPKDYLDILPILRREWSVDGEIYLNRQLGGGKSGALVYSVDIATKSFTGQAILKLDEAADSGWQERHEAELHQRAIDDAPDFAAKHLPRILHSVHHGHQIAVLSTIAGRGLEYAEPWVECSHDRQLAVVREVSSGVLEDWNADYRLNSGMRMPQELLQSWLDYRLDPAQGGRIHAFLGDECGVPTDTPAIICDGHWYPNPLAFAEGRQNIPEKARLRGAVGRCHGDFHGLNILVDRRQTTAPNYFLIDLALYQSEQFLFYDHAYFELTFLLNSRVGASASEWSSMVNQLSTQNYAPTRSGLRTDDIGLIELVQTLRQGLNDWIERHEADRLAFMESQALLARVAVGLNFAHKRIPLETRQMAYFYAASRLKEYLKLNRIDWPKSGPELRILTSGTLTPPASAMISSSDGEDLSLQPAIAPDPRTQQRAPGKTKRWVIAAAVAMIGVIGLVALLLRGDILPGPPERSADASATQAKAAADAAQDLKGLRSIAVLPFTNLNSGSDDSFADGLTIEIISVLASTGAFRIPGFTSAFQFKNNPKDLRLIGQTLDVEYVIEGTVRQVGDEVRIEANLIRTDNGFLVWSGTFREKASGVFVAQEKVATAIGEALSTPLDVDSIELEAKRTEDPQAYEAFLRGIALLEQRGKALVRSIAALERAVNIEPEFAAAWAALSIAYNIAPTYLRETSGQPVRPEVFYRKSKRAAFKGRDLDPNLAMVQHALGNMYNRDRQWLAAERAYKRALREDPANHRAMQDYGGLLHTVGRELESLDYLNRAKALDPINDLYVFMAARVAWQETRSQAQIDIIEEIFRNSPPFRELALRVIISQRVQDKKLPEARDLVVSCADCTEDFRRRALSLIDAVGVESAEQIFQRHKDDRFLSYQFLYEIGGADVVLDAFEYNGLRSYYRLQYFTVPWTLVGDIGSLDRFQSIASDMGLVDFWEASGWPPPCQPATDGRFTCK